MTTMNIVGRRRAGRLVTYLQSMTMTTPHPKQHRHTLLLSLLTVASAWHSRVVHAFSSRPIAIRLPPSLSPPIIIGSSDIYRPSSRSRCCIRHVVSAGSGGLSWALNSSIDNNGSIDPMIDPLASPSRQQQQHQPSQPSSSSSSSTAMKKKDLRTLQRFLEVECWKLPTIRSLDRTLLAVSDACKQINRIVQRAQTDDLYGAAIDPTTGQLAELNVQGECQQQLDVLCNTLMLRAFCGAANNAVCAVASEEEPLPRSCADVMGFNVGGMSGSVINVDGGKESMLQYLILSMGVRILMLVCPWGQSLVYTVVPRVVVSMVTKADGIFKASYNVVPN